MIKNVTTHIKIQHSSNQAWLQCVAHNIMIRQTKGEKSSKKKEKEKRKKTTRNHLYHLEHKKTKRDFNVQILCSPYNLIKTIHKTDHLNFLLYRNFPLSWEVDRCLSKKSPLDTFKQLNLIASNALKHGYQVETGHLTTIKTKHSLLNLLKSKGPFQTTPSLYFL